MSKQREVETSSSLKRNTYIFEQEIFEKFAAILAKDGATPPKFFRKVMQDKIEKHYVSFDGFSEEVKTALTKKAQALGFEEMQPVIVAALTEWARGK